MLTTRSNNPYVVSFPMYARQQPVSSFLGIIVKHLDRFKRVLIEVLADELEFFQDIGGYRDYVAPYCVCLEDVEQLARTCPNQFQVWIRAQKVYGPCHHGNGVPSGIRDSPSKDRDFAGGTAAENGSDTSNLLKGQQRRNIHLHTSST